MMAQYPDVFIMTFSIHIPNFVLLSQTAQLLLIFCYAAPLLQSMYKSFQADLNKERIAMALVNAPTFNIIHNTKPS